MLVPRKVNNMFPDQRIVFALELRQICLIKTVIEIVSLIHILAMPNLKYAAKSVIIETLNVIHRVCIKLCITLSLFNMSKFTCDFQFSRFLSRTAPGT